MYSRPHKVFVGIFIKQLSVLADKDTFVLPKLEIAKFLLEFLLNNLSVLADKDTFVLPKLEIEIERRLEGKFPSKEDRRIG